MHWRSAKCSRAATVIALMANMMWPTMALATDLSLVFEDPRVELDESRFLDQAVEHRFSFRNEGDAEVAVVEVVDISGSGQVAVTPTRIPPGGKGEVLVRQPMMRLGEFNHRYAILTDEPGRPRYRLTLSGFAQSAYDPEVQRIEFGWIHRSQGGEQRFELMSREVERLEIVGAEGLPEWLKLGPVERVGVAEEGVAATLVLVPGAPLGVRDGTVVLYTNVAHQPRQRVAWTASIFGDIVPSANVIDLGLGREGGQVETTVRFESRSGSTFEIERVEGLPSELNATFRPCQEDGDAPSACWLLTLVARSATRTNLNGECYLFVQGETEALPMRFRAIFVGRDTEIRQLEVPDAEGTS